MPKEFRWVLPFVAAELPCLARGENGNDAVPVVRFELLRGVDEDEAESTRRVDARENAGDVKDGGGGAGGAGQGAVGRYIGSGFEEGFDIGGSKERGGGGGEEDDWVWAGALFEGGDKGPAAAAERSGGHSGGGNSGGRVGAGAVAAEEDFGSFADI